MGLCPTLLAMARGAAWRWPLGLPMAQFTAASAWGARGWVQAPSEGEGESSDCS